MGILKILDDCGDTSNIENWEENLDGLNPVDNQVYVKQGIHSMALGVDADLDPTDVAYWSNLQSQGDLSLYQHGWIYLWVYFPTLDYLVTPGNSFRFYFANTAGNGMRFYFPKSQLVEGWNLCKCDLDKPDYATGPLDWSNINNLSIQIYASVGNTNDFTIYVDSIMLVKKGLRKILSNILTDILKN